MQTLTDRMVKIPDQPAVGARRSQNMRAPSTHVPKLEHKCFQGLLFRGSSRCICSIRNALCRRLVGHIWIPTQRY